MRKIRNKERCGWRGKRKRYSQFRAEMNQFWEEVYEKLVRLMCEENKLDLTEWYIVDKHEPWGKTFWAMRNQGYLASRSIAQVQTEVESKFHPNTLDKIDLLVKDEDMEFRTVPVGTKRNSVEEITELLYCLGWDETQNFVNTYQMFTQGEKRLWLNDTWLEKGECPSLRIHYGFMKVSEIILFVEDHSEYYKRCNENQANEDQ